MAPIIPFIPTIVSAVGGYFGRKKGAPSQQEQADATAQRGVAQQGANSSAAYDRFATPLLNSSADYYQKILRGDRAGLQQALAPEISATNDAYAGAERGLDRTGSQGAARDVAKASLDRERAGRVSMLFPAARQAAAAATGDLGKFGATAAASARQGSASVYESLLNGGREDRKIQLGEQGDFGSSIGSLLANAMKNQGSKQGGGGGGGLGNLGGGSGGGFGFGPVGSGTGSGLITH